MKKIIFLVLAVMAGNFLYDLIPLLFPKSWEFNVIYAVLLLPSALLGAALFLVQRELARRIELLSLDVSDIHVHMHSVAALLLKRRRKR